MFRRGLGGDVAPFLSLTLPSTAWSTLACDCLSLPHVALSVTVLAAGGAALALGRLRPAAGRSLRLAVVGGVGMAGLALTAVAFPQCAGSPFASFSDEIRYWLASVAEAQALVNFFQRKPGDAVSAVSLPVTALVAVGWRWAHSSDRTELRRRRPWQTNSTVLMTSCSGVPGGISDVEAAARLFRAQ